MITFSEFTTDIAKHRLTVLVNDGVRRHIRCSAGTWCQQFDVLTWPGHLCYTGDMGTFVFTRIDDMFQFFRAKERDEKSVSLQYWAEKLIAADKPDGYREYSEDKFKAAIKRWFDDHEFDSDDKRAECWKDIERNIFHECENEHDAFRAALDFQFDGVTIFQDFWEVNAKEYTGRFVWCCYALRWAIEQYDALTDGNQSSEAVASGVNRGSAAP